MKGGNRESSSLVKSVKASPCTTGNPVGMIVRRISIKGIEELSNEKDDGCYNDNNSEEDITTSGHTFMVDQVEIQLKAAQEMISFLEKVLMTICLVVLTMTLL